MRSILNEIVWRLLVLYQYIRKFGFLQGYLIFLQLYGRPLSIAKKIKRTIQLIYCDKPLRVRAGTSDVSVFEGVLLFKEYDLSFLNLHPKIILDVGANVGYTSIFFAKCYPQSRILAIEPEKSNFQLLLNNTEPYQNIIPIQAAVWHENGKLQIRNPETEKWGFQVNDSKDELCSFIVDALTVDDLIEMTDENTIDIAKFDIEGAEVEVFGNNYEKWLRKIDVIVIELHDRLREGCSDTLNRAVSGYDFQRIQRGEHTILFKPAKVAALEKRH
jgi:FkbM family methyltransferase